MAIGIFLSGVDSIEDVLAIRATAMEAIRNGTEISSWSSEGTSVSKVLTLPATKILEECNAFLKKEDPATYGYLIKRTSPYFRD